MSNDEFCFSQQDISAITFCVRLSPAHFNHHPYDDNEYNDTEYNSGIKPGLEYITNQFTGTH
jgi:hypothetical protein